MCKIKYKKNIYMKYLLLFIIIIIIYYLYNRKLEVIDSFKSIKNSDCSINFITVIYNKIHKPIVENIINTISKNKDIINCIIENNEKCEKNQISKSNKFKKNNLKLNLDATTYNVIINDIINDILNETDNNIDIIVDNITSDLNISKTDSLTAIINLYLQRVIVNNLYLYNTEIDEYDKQNSETICNKGNEFCNGIIAKLIQFVENQKKEINVIIKLNKEDEVNEFEYELKELYDRFRELEYRNKCTNVKQEEIVINPEIIYLIHNYNKYQYADEKDRPQIKLENMSYNANLENQIKLSTLPIDTLYLNTVQIFISFVNELPKMKTIYDFIDFLNVNNNIFYMGIILFVISASLLMM